MKLVWSPRDTAARHAAMTRHPAYLHAIRRLTDEAETWFEHHDYEDRER